MRRRTFVAALAGAAGASGLGYWRWQEIDTQALYPGRNEGHWLRDARPVTASGQRRTTEVVIIGSGIAALSAAWKLARVGMTDYLVLSGPEPMGNAAGGRFGDLRYPTGAHYLPLPSLESVHVREMLQDVGVIENNAFSRTPTFDERVLLHAPAERVLHQGTWQDGYLPQDNLPSGERREQERFFAQVDELSRAVGADGRRAFVVPIELASDDVRYTALDAMSFRDWLDQERYFSPTLRWYLNYCCRDDYGAGFDRVSAWFGLHYFAARVGEAANAERGAVLTWPEGLGELARRLAVRGLPVDRVVAGTAQSIEEASGRVTVKAFDLAGPVATGFTIEARRAIVATPLLVASRIVPSSAMAGFDLRRDVPAYAPWMVSNFLMRDFPDERPGAPLAWDNVVYDEPGLGFVVSTHQDIRVGPPQRTVFTAYHALSTASPESARAWMDRAATAELLDVAAADLRLAYGWRLAPCVEKVEITMRGHGMATPPPGILSQEGLRALRGASGRILFAHSDLSGYSVFEEAAWWGYRAAQRILGVK